MIIKMVNKFKLTVVHVTYPNPMQICACAWSYPLDKKPPGRWAAGLLLAKPRQECLTI